MANILRAWGFQVQEEQGTPADGSAITWLSYMESGDFTDHREFDVLEYERGDTEWTEGDVEEKTRWSEFNFNLKVDAREYPRLMLAFGQYDNSTPNTHVFYPGRNPDHFITVWFWYGIGTEVWRAHDV